MPVSNPSFSHFLLWSFLFITSSVQIRGAEWNQDHYHAKNVEQLQASFKKNLTQVQEDMEALKERLYKNIKIKPLSLGTGYRPRVEPRIDFNQSRVNQSMYKAKGSSDIPSIRTLPPRLFTPIPDPGFSPPSSDLGPSLNHRTKTNNRKKQIIENEPDQNLSPIPRSRLPLSNSSPEAPRSLSPIILPKVEMPPISGSIQSVDLSKDQSPDYSEANGLTDPNPLARESTPKKNLHSNFDFSYSIQTLRISYGGDPQGLPELKPLAQATLLLGDGTEVSLGTLLSGNPSGLLYKFKPENLRELSQLIVHYLKEKGFEGMIALVDPQDIDPFTGKDLRRGGDLSLDFLVWVSRVDDVRFDYDSNLHSPRNPWNLKKQIADQMNREGVLGQPLRSSFKKSIKRLNRHPSKSARLLLLPANRPGEVDAVVEVREQKNLAFSLGASNSGSPTTGEWLINGMVQTHELTHNDDPADFRWVISDTGERYGFSGGYMIPLVQPGVLDLSLRSTYTEYDGTSFAVTAFEFEGSSCAADLALRGSPLGWEGKVHTFSYELGVNFERAKAYNSIFQEQSKIDFFVPHFGFHHDRKGGVIRSLSSLLFRTNLSSIPVAQRELFGGLQVEDRVPSIHFSHISLVNLGRLLEDGTPSFESKNLHSILFQLRASGSLNGERMLPSMQSILGGASGVRGYPEACVAGDRAFWLSLEYQWKFLSSNTWGLTLVPFLDYGKTFIHDLMPHEAENTLSSWGIGLGVDLPAGGKARLDFAKPLRKVFNGNGDIREGTLSDDYRVHASTQWKF